MAIWQSTQEPHDVSSGSEEDHQRRNSPPVTGAADAAGLDRSYVRRLVNLTLLSPDLVRAILAGTEPDGLSISRLMTGVPERWEEQAIPHRS